MHEVIIWGGTGQAKVLKECIEYKNMKVIALFDNNKFLKSPFTNIPIYYGKSGLKEWMTLKNISTNAFFLVAIGGDKGVDRIKIHKYLKSLGFKSLTAVHPTAFIASNATIGEGSQILAQSSICAEVKIGQSCIVNTGAIVDHECIIKNGVHICPGAHLAGCVNVEDYAMIGTGAVILPNIKIGKFAKIGAGSVVTKNVVEKTTVAGNPATVLSRSDP
jgi:sugar O-acyltransferase (sialic acid O-acetyltransferase NeuD family)